MGSEARSASVWPLAGPGPDLDLQVAAGSGGPWAQCAPAKGGAGVGAHRGGMELMQQKGGVHLLGSGL